MFSLATQPDMTTRIYRSESGDTIEIQPSLIGLPTTWDKDLLIYCVSQLMAGINLGKAPCQVLRITAHDLLVSTNRQTGGDHYKRIEIAFTRLRSSQIVTNIETNGVRVKRGFGFIDYWEIVDKSETDNRMIAVKVKLSDWLYNAVPGTELLTINRDYFRLRGGLERRLYEVARKHCGAQPKWVIGIAKLHLRTGSRSPLKAFRNQLKKIVAANILPDYRIQINREKDQLIVYNRKGSKAAKAMFDDDIKQLFKPVKNKRQASLDF